MKEEKRQELPEDLEGMPSKPARKRNNLPGQRRCSDRDLAWVDRDYPELHAWRTLARDWLSGETEAVHVRL
jgi:hypothetical protein